MTVSSTRDAPAQATDAVTAGRAARDLANPAFITVLDDDAARVASDIAPDGPMHGVPFAVKDNIDVAGLPTTVGWPSRSSPAASSAAAVQRLVAAGAVPIGKTNMDQFATGLVGTRTPYGACHCVASPRHVSGGSSSGSAVAVAAGVAPFALATDTAGSGRVPAAFNGLVGVKPTRGLVSTRGVFPACPSLDCVSVLAGTVSMAGRVLDVIVGYDRDDPWSRPAPVAPPAGIARVMRVVGVPAAALDLDDAHGDAWQAVLGLVTRDVRTVPVDVSPLLEAAQLLYGGPFVAERLAAFGHLLVADDPRLDPVVRSIVLGSRDLRAEEVFAAQHRLKQLSRQVEALFAGIDAILLPTTPGHPTFAEVAADPVGVNNRLGTYTNMANLLDLCAVALPLATRRDGLPFGVQLLAPAFADAALLGLSAALLGEPSRDRSAPLAGRSLLAVCGAHLAGEPLNEVLLRAGAWLHSRALTASGYRMVRLPGATPRPGLIDDGAGPDAGLEVELWDVPSGFVRQLASDTEAPLCIGGVRLSDGSNVAGFAADPDGVGDAPDISASGGWRAHLRATMS